jgi:hypothetical protein
MVIDGTRLKNSDLTSVEFRDGRFDLPRHLIEVARFPVKTAARSYFLVITAGRYRLVNPPTEDPDVSRIEREAELVGEPGGVLDYTDDNLKPAIRARWIECNVSPHSGSWRISVPIELQDLALEREKRNFVFIVTVAGFVEIWFPETLARAVSTPISELLRRAST